MKKFGVSAILAPAAMIAVLAVSNAAFAHDDEDDAAFLFEAAMSGAQEVPEVATDTSGSTHVMFAEDLSMGMFRVKVEDGLDVTAAHIHCGAAGVNGPITVTLFSGGPLDVDGVLADGPFFNADITPTDCGSNVAALRAAMVQEGTYINVHTSANPAGEVRGQLLEDD